MSERERFIYRCTREKRSPSEYTNLPSRLLQPADWDAITVFALKILLVGFTVEKPSPASAAGTVYRQLKVRNRLRTRQACNYVFYSLAIDIIIIAVSLLTA